MRLQITLRPPNLSVSELVFDNCNVPLIDCSIDSKDWMQGTTKAQILDNVRGAKDIPLFPGVRYRKAEYKEPRE